MCVWRSKECLIYWVVLVIVVRAKPLTGSDAVVLATRVPSLSLSPSPCAAYVCVCVRLCAGTLKGQENTTRYSASPPTNRTDPETPSCSCVRNAKVISARRHHRTPINRILPPSSVSYLLHPSVAFFVPVFLLSRRASQPSQALNQPEGRNLKAKRAKKEPSERSQQKQQQQQQGLVGDLFVSRKGQADAFIRLKRSGNV